MIKSDLILRSLGKRSRSKIKITYYDLDHTKDQDQLSDLDLLDQDHWSFNSSVAVHAVAFIWQSFGTSAAPMESAKL